MSNKNYSQSQSLPKLPPIDLTTSKLFNNLNSLNDAKKAFIELINRQSSKPINPDKNKLMTKKRSLIQLPRTGQKNGFISFTDINKSETKSILENLSKLRSKSTSVQSHIKAEILSNQNQMQKIVFENENKVKVEQEYISKKLKELSPTKMKKQIKIKPKYQNKKKVITSITLTMDFNVYEHNLEIWKPYIDFQSVTVAFKQKFFFIGGRKLSPIVSYDFETDKWVTFPINEEIKPFGDTQGTIIDPKNGHKVLFFGGNQYFQPNFTEMSNSMKIIDLQNNSVEIRKFREDRVPSRAYHSQCLYGQYIIVSGGIDKNNKYFNTFMNYNFVKKFWSQLVVNKSPQQLRLGFAKHCTLPIFHKRKSYSIYDEEPILEVDNRVQMEGVYIYGGEDKNGNLLSKMYIMKLGSPSVNIIEPEVRGKPPIARRNARMTRSKQFIIIHGGRNEDMRPYVLNSMHFFSLETMTWIEVTGEKPPYRFSHAISSQDNKIMILGGRGVEGLTKQVFIMEYKESIQFI